jgi:hypothetical protein
MRRPLTVSAALGALGAVPLVVILIVLPGQRSRALDVYVLYLGALALLALARATAATGPDDPEAVRRTRGAHEVRLLLEDNLAAYVFHGEPSTALRTDREPRSRHRLPELARIEREVVLSTGSEFDQQLRVKPLLRDVAAHRLWIRRGVDMDENPERAREVLGDEVWELVKPGPPEPNRRYSSGLDIAGLKEIVDRIEAV